ncbi:MAG: acyltransferase [Burkholderiales bacterium]|nr:acyltransferase [Flavobacterium sp.]
MKLKYFNNLDGLRAIAAIGVVIAHFFDEQKLASHPLLFKIAQMGNTGVSLFFVLSGFVITRILFNTVKSKNYFSSFYGRRTLRIFPLYYFSLLCYNYLPYLLNINPTLGDFNKQWYHYFYLQNFARTFGWDFQGPGHFWSLAVEEHFYLIWPALVFLAYSANKNRLLFISILLIVFTFALRWIMLNHHYEIDVFTFTRLDQLALGCILAILEYKGILEKTSNRIFLGLMILGFILVAYSSTFSYFYLNLFKHNAFGLLYFAVLAFCIKAATTSWLNRFLTSAVMQFLGKISYGLYIWHVLAILLMEHYFRSLGLMADFSLLLLITIIMSTLSFYFLETPFLKLKKYFNSNL